MYLRNLISEDEKRRISNLHNSRIKSEFGKLLFERGPGEDPNIVKRNDPDLSPELNKINAEAFDLEDFIATVKQQVDNFPEDGYVSNLANHGVVWAVREPGTSKVKYYLKQDGSVVGPDMTTIAKNKWFSTPIQVNWPTKTAVSSGPTVPTGTQGTGTQGAPQKLMGGRELKDLEKQLKQQANQQRKAQKKLTKENVQKCRSTFDTYVKYFGDEQRKANLIKDPKGAESFTGYTSEIESCCPIFSKDKRYLPNVQKQGFCAIQTAAGPGYEGFNADSDGNGVPDYLQANPIGATGTGATGTGTTGAGGQNKPGIGVSGMGRLSAEDQELRDLGLQ